MGTFILPMGIVIAVSLAQIEPESFLPLPELVVRSPRSGETYMNTASLAVSGRMSPVVSTSVRIQILTDGPQGPTQLIGIGNVHVDDEGWFGLTVDPPETGWPELGVRVWVTIPSLPQVKGDTRFNLKAGTIGPVEPIVDPPSSDIVIDWDDLPALPPRIPFDETFLVRGTFTDVRATSPVRGPRVHVELMAGNVLMESSGFISLRDPNDPTRFRFEAPLSLPHVASEYTVKLHVRSESAERREEEFTVIPLPKKLPK